MRRLTDRVDRIPPLTALAIASAIAAAVAFLDYATGRLSFTDFYLLACFLAAWRVGAWGGLAVTGLCGVGMFWTDRMLGFTAPLHLWNRAIQLSMLAVVSLLVTALRRSHAALRQLAQHDPLTGLDNRPSFTERAELEVAIARREGKPFTIAYLDLDDFKAVNDSFGHAEGDRVLQAVGGVLRRRVRATDACARMGGDEFAVLLHGASPDVALQVLEQLRDELRAEMARGGWRVGVSTGAVTVRQFGGALDELLRMADRLMYEAKRTAKGSMRHEVR